MLGKPADDALVLCSCHKGEGVQAEARGGGDTWGAWRCYGHFLGHCLPAVCIKSLFQTYIEYQFMIMAQGLNV